VTGTTRPAELAAAALAALALAVGACAEDGTSPDGSIGPEEAEEIEETLDDVEDGRPYDYEQDGGVFRNDEMLLPDRPRGHYLEFTVETSGEDDRGERRLVIGRSGEVFYTEDHYESFSPIEPEDYSARLP
jgi:ribonuclease T1